MKNKVHFKLGIYWPTKGREIFSKKASHEEPQDFLYGFSDFKKKFKTKVTIVSIDSRRKMNSILSIVEEFLVKKINSFTRFKFFYYVIKYQKSIFLNQHLIISFTDSGSLSLGLFGRRFTKRPKLIGGFHALADILQETNVILRFLYKYYITKSLKGLDHIFFFGEEDRKQSIKLFKLNEDKTSIFKFGIDTKFWHPSQKIVSKKTILSVGSDPKRDYETLINAPQKYHTKILTSLNIKIPSNCKHIEHLKGNFFKSLISNQKLRKLYNEAYIIVIPIKNVFQPSGYSVTLQALACGKPVILPYFRGLWDKEVFKDRNNCLFYIPEDKFDLASKINDLMGNAHLFEKLAINGRKTALKFFSLDRMSKNLETIIFKNILDENKNEQ